MLRLCTAMLVLPIVGALVPCDASANEALARRLSGDDEGPSWDDFASGVEQEDEREAALNRALGAVELLRSAGRSDVRKLDDHLRAAPLNDGINLLGPQEGMMLRGRTQDRARAKIRRDLEAAGVRLPELPDAIIPFSGAPDIQNLINTPMTEGTDDPDLLQRRGEVLAIARTQSSIAATETQLATAADQTKQARSASALAISRAGRARTPS